MSQDKVCKFWCLPDGEGKAFTAEANLEWDVDELTKAIRQERGSLRKFDASDIVLFKLNEPIPVDPEESLLQRLPKQIKDSSVELKRTDQVSDVFPHRPKKHLQIIVTLREYPIPLRRSNIRCSGEVDGLIDEFLAKCRPRMRILVANANDIPSFLPSWEPKKSKSDERFTKHVRELCIPAVSGGQLSLLLHNLGEDRSNLDRERADRIPDIFSFAKHTVLVNTSGSGKTRLLLEGLCRRWGFYFVARPDSVGTGSSDLHRIVDDFDFYQDYERATLMTNDSSGLPSAVRHIRETARRGLCQLLLARFLLLNLLVEEVKLVPQPLPWAQYRRLWVLLQVQPNVIFGTDFQVDVFTDFSLLLRPASRSDLEDRIRVKYQELSFLLTKVNNPATRKDEKPPFVCVLDEAQITTGLRNGDFFSETSPTKRPVLREIWLSWTSVLNPQQMRLVISGTGVELQLLLETLNSPALKPENYQLQHDIGAFENAEHQAEYIKQYIPADWADERWKEFLNRAWAWFRGRYRSTATLISLILQAGYQSPHRTINAYVEAFTDFRPTDAGDWTIHEPELPFNLKSEVSRLNFSKMDEMQSKTLSEILFDQFLYGSYCLSPFTADERALFVQYGFARHKPGMDNTVLDEPLMILAALDWVNKKSHLSHAECLKRDIEKHSKRKNGFEAYFAFYIRKVFETPKKLDEVFSFRSDFVKRLDQDLPWQAEDFELVTVVATANRNQPQVSVVTPSCGPSSNVGFLAESGDEVLEWLSTNKNQFAFCFPPESFGSDILFFIRLVTSGELLLVLGQCRKYKTIAKSDLITGVRTVSPPWLWKSKNKKYETAASAPSIKNDGNDCDKLAGQTKEALANIPLGLYTGADFPVLRIFASFPGEAYLDRTRQETVDEEMTTNTAPREASSHDADLHPLATLHLDNLNKQLDISWFRGDVEQKEVVHLKRSANSLEPSERKRVRLY